MFALNSVSRLRQVVTGVTLAGGLALAGAQAQAAVIIGNVSGSYNTTGTASGIAIYSSKGIGFAPNANVSVSDVILNLKDTTGSLNSFTTVSVQIYEQTGSGTYLGSRVGTFNSPSGSLTATATNYTFTPTSPISLTSGTSYWLLVIGSSVDGFSWDNSNPTITPTGSYATVTGARFGGGTPSSPDLSNGSSSNYNLFEIEGTVPEPSMIGFLGLGISIVGLRRHRRTSN